MAECTEQSLLLHSPLSLLLLPQACLSLQQNGVSCSDFPKDLMEGYILLCTFRHPCSLMHFLTHPLHPAVLTRDNHSCGSEHHPQKWYLLLNISSFATITQHLKTGFSSWLTHPWKPHVSSVGLFTSIHYLKGLDSFASENMFSGWRLRRIPPLSLTAQILVMNVHFLPH